MTVYGKLFKSMFDGTLRRNWKAAVVFQQMIIFCDPDGVFDMTPEALHHRTGIPLDLIEEGIKELETPDPESRSPAQDGRRIVRISKERNWGWQIVNHAYYRSLQKAADKRQQNRDRQRRFRDKKKPNNESSSRSVTPRNDPSRRSRHTNTDTDTGTEREKHTKPLTLPDDFEMTPEMEAQAKERGIAANLHHETEKFKAHHISKGTVSRDWGAAWILWMLRTLERKDPTNTTPVDSNEMSRKDLLDLAKLYELEQGQDESDEDFKARVLDINDRRIARQETV